MPLSKHKEIFLTKNIAMLAVKVVFWRNVVFKVRNTPDNLTLADRFYCRSVYLLVQGRQFAAPLKCRPPASGVSGGGRYATEEKPELKAEAICEPKSFASRTHTAIAFCRTNRALVLLLASFGHSSRRSQL